MVVFVVVTGTVVVLVVVLVVAVVVVLVVLVAGAIVSIGASSIGAIVSWSSPTASARTTTRPTPTVIDATNTAATTASRAAPLRRGGVVTTDRLPSPGAGAMRIQ